ncbi:hypothetical protein NSB25_12290 [Acetatifactor muris]|uniref:Lipoprotein n=1 Tax=Acetatifactor muris TaxID=879566 RepID=A0A2K4ZHB4_9FIRM|nr:hypothetical protein [Acetatifactor muris]MCI8800070.1 hypothetical protein [Lachnospiraceae bacterium]MCR2048066.1 hypothetical protein [Acetatifactor muris]SOY29859.1 hypothetical protein AMURIS_02580 [Acetatifactor muris]
MKKRILAGLICLMTLFSGCGNSAKTIEGNVAVKESGVDSEAAPETDDASGMPEERPEGTPEDMAADYSGYVFIHNGVVIEMDVDAASVIEQLGEPDSYFEAPSCAFEGIDKIYTYGSFELDTYPTDKKDYVSSVIFKDDTITTTEGIGIGDSVDKMEEAYGTGRTDENGMTVYEKGDMKLCFILEGETIVSIEYRSKVLDN